jgi:serine/threonine-protein kinase
MGVLWVAHHLSLDLRVVVKFLADELRDDPRAASRLAREAGALARVKSPHVVQVLDCGVSDAGDPFVVMELLEGRDLSTHLAERGPVVPEEAISLVGQLARALSRAHAAGLVHRDVKPSNVFLCEVGDTDLHVKLLDFGVAKSLVGRGGSTQSGSMVGTPAYMSPEQIVGAEVSARADIWGLGVLAFEVLTGRRPFEGETTGALSLAIHTLDRPSLRRFVPSLPESVDSWFARACAIAPEARFASALEAATALGAALGGLQHSARAATPPFANGTLSDVQARSARPHRRVARLPLAIGMLALLALAAWRLPSASSAAATPAPPALVGPLPLSAGADIFAPSPSPIAEAAAATDAGAPVASPHPSAATRPRRPLLGPRDAGSPAVAPPPPPRELPDERR